MRRLRAGLLAGVVVSLACEPAPPRASLVRDSAGVTIVESYRPSWERAAWNVGEPSLTLVGGPEGDLVSADGALRLSDGRVVVSDPGAVAVRYFSPDGIEVARFDRDAEGGAEVREINSITAMERDSILAFDGPGGRAYVLGPDGRVARTFGVSWDGDLPLARVEGVTSDGLVVRPGFRASTVEGAGVVRVPMPFLVLGETVTDTIVTAPGSAVATATVGAGRMLMTPVLGHVTVSDFHDGRLYVGTGEQFRIDVYGVEGSLERVVALPERDLTVSPAEIREAREARPPMGNPIAARIMERLQAELPDPTSRPAYGELLVDRGGNLWVGAYPRLGVAASTAPPALWTLFDADGVWLGELELPPGLQPTDIGEDYVLGVTSTTASSVVLHPLSRALN